MTLNESHVSMPDPQTSIFYDLVKNDQIGHKIVCGVKFKKLNTKRMLKHMRERMSETVQRYPHFSCRLIDHRWQRMPVNYKKLVVAQDRTHADIINDLLNTPFEFGMPAWQIILTNDKHLILVCDHSYGDGAYMANCVAPLWFSDGSLADPPPKKEKKGLSFLSRIYIFLKVMFLLFMRFRTKSVACSKKVNNKQARLACFSLEKLNDIRAQMGKDGLKPSMNDLLHTLIVKTLGLYLKKDIISSAAMFNTRENIADLTQNNKLGYILLANKVKDTAASAEVLADVRTFMQFYKQTPITFMIPQALQWYYMIDHEGAVALMRRLNNSVDFLISNYVIPYKGKEMYEGAEIDNIFSTVTPCDASRLFSIITYGDNINLFFTYNADTMPDIDVFQKHFGEACEWIVRDLAWASLK